jgi:hypothetical protein
MTHQLMDIFRSTLHVIGDGLLKLMPTGLGGAIATVAVLLIVGMVIGFFGGVTENRGGDPQAGS